ncbi:MAG: hypothetical protein U0871_01990 [Gemmataceae bacterium]
MIDTPPRRGPGRKKAVTKALERPPAPPVFADRLPPSLTASAVWVCWRWVNDASRGWTKPPLSARTLKPCDVTDPDALALIEAALARVTAGRADGVGVALAPAGLLGVDLDDCRDPATGDIVPWANAIIAELDGYAEVSPSGTGVKVLVRAAKPGPRCRAGDVEVYDAGRYFTLTGHTLPGSADDPPARQPAVDAAVRPAVPGDSGPAARVDRRPGGRRGPPTRGTTSCWPSRSRPGTGPGCGGCSTGTPPGTPRRPRPTWPCARYSASTSPTRTGSPRSSAGRPCTAPSGTGPTTGIAPWPRRWPGRRSSTPRRPVRPARRPRLAPPPPPRR